MTGLTVGPRQFTLQKDVAFVKVAGGPAGPADFNSPSSDWVSKGKYEFNQTKLDLRPYYQANDTKALDMLNITLQEGPIWANGSDEIGLFTTDMLTTVRLSLRTIDRIGASLVLPGFLSSTDVVSSADEQSKLSPSQIIWGLWRYFDHEATLGGRPLIVRASSFFGEGEIIVSPALYWTRIVTQYGTSEGDWTNIPAANLVMHAAAVDISDGQEIAQMSRMAQA